MSSGLPPDDKKTEAAAPPKKKRDRLAKKQAEQALRDQATAAESQAAADVAEDCDLQDSGLQGKVSEATSTATSSSASTAATSSSSSSTSSLSMIPASAGFPKIQEKSVTSVSENTHIHSRMDGLQTTLAILARAVESISARLPPAPAIRESGVGTSVTAPAMSTAPAISDLKHSPPTVCPGQSNVSSQSQSSSYSYGQKDLLDLLSTANDSARAIDHSEPVGRLSLESHAPQKSPHQPGVSRSDGFDLYAAATSSMVRSLPSSDTKMAPRGKDDPSQGTTTLLTIMGDIDKQYKAAYSLHTYVSTKHIWKYQRNRHEMEPLAIVYDQLRKGDYIGAFHTVNKRLARIFFSDDQDTWDVIPLLDVAESNDRLLSQSTTTDLLSGIVRNRRLAQQADHYTGRATVPAQSRGRTRGPRGRRGATRGTSSVQTRPPAAVSGPRKSPDTTSVAAPHS